jgi:hypothetical protein
MQGGLVAFIQRKIAKTEKTTMDKPHSRKIEHVVLSEGEDKNPIEIFRCAELCI